MPLKPERIRKLLVVGDNANRAHSGGGGSAEIKALYEITPLLGIKMLLGGNTRVDFCQGYLADDLLTKEAGWQEEEPERRPAERLPGKRYGRGAAEKAERTSRGSPAESCSL